MTEQECRIYVGAARSDGLAIVVWGGGTCIDQGNPLRASAYSVLETGGLCGVSEYSPSDMVVTAGAGTTLAEVQDILGRDGQFLPIDAPMPDRATLGGIVATNAQGLWRPAFGAPRDRLLGLRAVLAAGEAVKAGGKVVKNVAGYDLCKLFAGSWGTLGVITEVTFKTNPLPEARAYVAYRARSAAAAAEAGLAVYTRHLEPAYLVAVGGPPWHLCAGYMGSAEAVAWHSGEVGSALRDAGLHEDPEGPPEGDVRLASPACAAPLQARLSMRPTDLPAAVRLLDEVGASMVVHVATGIVDASIYGSDRDLRAAAEVIPRCVGPAGAHVWTRVPASWRPGLDVWGAPRGEAALMRALKAALDPDALFAPGRYAGGL